MTAIDDGSLRLGARLRPALALRVRYLIAGIGRAWRNRRDMRRLAEMSDWQLNDIGLTRSDLFDVYDGPIVADPTERLYRIARDRARRESAARRIS